MSFLYVHLVHLQAYVVSLVIHLLWPVRACEGGTPLAFTATLARGIPPRLFSIVDPFVGEPELLERALNGFAP